MTAGEAIERADSRRPDNRVDAEEKQRWLRTLDGQLRQQAQRCGSRFYDAVGADLAVWEHGLPDDTPLMVGPPYEAMYIHYLCAQLDLMLGETERYNNEAEQYDRLAAAWASWLRRHTRPRIRLSLRW